MVDDPDGTAKVAEPDCDRCDDTELDPDAYTVMRNDDGTEAWMHVPCRDCQPEED